MGEINVLHVGGYTSTNIGNAFYNLGIRHVLKSLGKEINLFTTSDLQSYAWSRFNTKKASSFDPCKYFTNMDYIIWSGPMLGTMYVKKWINILRKANAVGTKIICMSAGGNRYTREEIEEVRSILKEFRLYALFSRDFETYENYKDLFEHSYSGICCAFYIPEYFKSWKLDVEPYVVFNFEQHTEPLFVKANEGFEFAEKWGGLNFGRLVKDGLYKRNIPISCLEG